MRDNALPVGAVVSGRYRILKVLGQGGFGITYLVRDEYLATELALKECFPEQCVIRDVNGSQSVIPLPTKEELFHKLKEKFIEEARTLFGLHGDVHIEGIVHVYNVEEANNTGYMAMEYLDGETLKSYLNAQGPVDCIWLLTLVKPVLLALQCIHTQGLLHRDIAPDNLMLIQRNGKEKLVLIDFGAVKQVAKGSTTIAIAKPGYAPPEQFDPKEKPTWATDIYALCATIYAMLGGSVPADATTRLSGIVLSRKDPLIGLHELNAQIPQEVDNIIAKGMQLDATKRYQSANEMAEDVERFLKKKQSITVEYYYNAILGKTEYVQKQAHSTLNIEQPNPEPKPQPKPQPNPEPKPQPKPKPHKATKRWWIALAVLLAIAGCIAFFVPHLQKQDAEPQYAVGDYVTFGTYPQTAEGNDETPIEWLVLDCDGNNVLLLSRYGLDAQPYNTEDTGITWEKCTLRTWLNKNFLNRAFTEAEQSAILLTNVDNSSSQCYRGYSSSGGNNTQDKLFLLSYAEAYRYFGVTYTNVKNTKSRVAPTAYAIARGSYTPDNYKTADGQATWWWLRSPGCDQYDAADVHADGSLDNSYVFDERGSVRPALWVNLESGIF